MAFNTYWPGFVPGMDFNMDGMYPMLFPYPQAFQQHQAPPYPENSLMPEAFELNDPAVQLDWCQGGSASSSTDTSEVSSKLNGLESLLLEIREE